ncbi:MAG: hypothetical protein OEZ06_13575 [Myxococcales bacterium]|nr:hypothetical protein [Myxococcales bacterium]
MTAIRPVVAALLAATLLLSSWWCTSARAYCFSTTCDSKHESCGEDEHGCPIEGEILHWARSCTELWLPTSAEPLPGITREQFTDAAALAS